jgi:hypothetical protein
MKGGVEAPSGVEPLHRSFAEATTPNDTDND